MKRALWAMLAVAALVFPVISTSHAQDFKPYMGVGGGVFALTYEETGATYSLYQRNPTWGAFIKGGVDINDYVGAELRLGMTGEPSTDWPVGTLGSTAAFNIATKVDNFISYLTKIGTPIGPSGHMHIYLGGTTAKAKIAASVAGSSGISANATKTGFTYGLGYDFVVNSSTKISTEWMEYWTNVDVGSSAAASVTGSFRGVSVSIQMEF